MVIRKRLDDLVFPSDWQQWEKQIEFSRVKGDACDLHGIHIYRGAVPMYHVLCPDGVPAVYYECYWYRFRLRVKLYDANQNHLATLDRIRKDWYLAGLSEEEQRRLREEGWKRYFQEEEKCPTEREKQRWRLRFYFQRTPKDAADLFRAEYRLWHGRRRS